MKDKVRISDIALRSGVSVASVSLVLNHREGVSEATRAKVLEAARVLGYNVRPPAPAPRKEPPGTIGMLVKVDPDIPPNANPFYSKVMVGIEDACRRGKYNLLFATLPVDEDNHPLEIPAMLLNDSVQGLILAGICLDDPFPLPAGKQELPMVLVDGYSKTDAYDTVISDNIRAACQAVDYLFEKGHRHIGLVGGDEDCFPSIRDRRSGYFQAMSAHQIGETAAANFNINRSKGFEETTRLLKEHPEITALFCVNDDAAGGAIRAAQSLGRRVPEDLSVVGYDDTILAQHTHPPLTTFHVDTFAMGRLAVQVLNLRLEQPDLARITMTIHPRLVERESVACLPAGPAPEKENADL